MWRLISPIFASPLANTRLLLASLCIHLLGLAPAFYVTLIYGRYMSHGLDSTLLTLTSGALLAMLLEAALRWVRRRMITALVAREERLRADRMMHTLLTAQPEAFAQLPAAERQELTRSLDTIQQAVTPGTILAFLDAPFAVIFWLALMAMAWQLGSLAMLIAVVALLLVYLRVIKLGQQTKEQQKATLKQQTLLASAERIETIRLTNAAPMLARQWSEAAGEARLLRHDTGNSQDRMQMLIQNATALISIGVIGFGAKLTMLQILDAGALFGASILATRMFSLLMRPVQSVSLLLRAVQSLELLERIFQWPQETEQGTRLPSYTGRLEFKDLAFAYAGGVGPLFESLSLTIEPGQLVVITGSNGTGKSTLAKLIAGLLQPTRGLLLADGVELRQLVRSWWRQQLVFLPQEPEFIDGPLRQNLASLTPRIRTAALQNLIRKVGLGDFLDQHPQGLGMPITQGGRNLSPGIRRRLALVRALTTRGRLVVIDEPNEGLDPQGGRIMNGLLSALKQEGRTLIICTQNPPMELMRQASTVINLDSKPVPGIIRPGNTPTTPAAPRAIGHEP